ncbi:Mpo1-like protein [uncultured Hymenobacter sp.]|uniref:Mpo1-like protein n=1 Tax=uncultured Hymenobacter sp. TaxID=170016 RepID=UPI0035CAA4FC
MPSLPLKFAEFYPRYLREHSRRGTRVLHFIGTTSFLVALVLAAVWQRPMLILVGIVAAYGFAWIGHFFVEHNRPATFQHPWLSLRGDFQLYWDLLRGRESF